MLDKKRLSEIYLQKTNNDSSKVMYGNFQQTENTVSVARLLCIDDMLTKYSMPKYQSLYDVSSLQEYPQGSKCRF
jgi:hypothetical protein